MVGRRDFLKILGLTTLAGMTPPMLEALGDEKGVPIPGLLLDTLERPLVIPVGGIQHVSLAEMDEMIKRKIIPGLVDAYFKQDPLLAYLRKIDAKGDDWRERKGFTKMDHIWIPDKEGKPIVNVKAYPDLVEGAKVKVSPFWAQDRRTRIVLDSGKGPMR